MKTIPELIREIHVDQANFEHIARTGYINGTLYSEIQRVMAVYACQEIIEALKLHGIEDPSTKKNEFVIPDVSVSLPCTHVWQQTDPYWKHCTVCGLIEPLRQ